MPAPAWPLAGSLASGNGANRSTVCCRAPASSERVSVVSPILWDARDCHTVRTAASGVSRKLWCCWHRKPCSLWLVFSTCFRVALFRYFKCPCDTRVLEKFMEMDFKTLTWAKTVWNPPMQIRGLQKVPGKIGRKKKLCMAFQNILFAPE